MRTVGIWQFRKVTVLFTLCAALLLPLPALAATPAPMEQRTGSNDTPAPIDTLEDVQQAVVRIEAVGVFKDPSEGMLMEAGSGSGFIIDEEGRVVTNNHVVTGAGFYRVYLEGKDDPVNARVLGVSECADLAVIDLQGDGYPFLAWYEDPIKVGLDVYAAGFPLGDPEYTLTRGIVAKARADGETDWASVDGVIQHDADINPGNSGGPLVTADGRVVGVNYAGDRDVNQFFAIGYDEAVRVVEQLLAGNDVDSIGVNGRAILSDDGQFSGIWVSSVASGSPADTVGMEPGDIIISLESLPVGEDGTMSTYCEILRSHSADDVMTVEVLRLDTDEVLEGQLNGRQLAQSLSLADQTGGEEAPQQDTGADTPATAAAETYDEFVEVSDGEGIFTFSAPAEWTDVADGEWVYDDNTVGTRFDISPDLANFFDNWGIPGAILRYSESLPQEMTVEELVDAYTLEESCTKGDRDTIELGDLSGYYQIWDECADTTTSGAIVALEPTESQAYYVLLELYGGEQRDFNAWDTILDSLVVTPAGTGNNADTPAPEPTTTTDSPLFDLVDTSGLIYSYVALEDAAISALIPEEYGDIEYTEWQTSDGEPLGFIVTAAPNIDDFRNTWTTPGMIVKSAIGLTEELDADEMLTDDSLAETCTFDDRYTYEHEAFGTTYNVVYDVYNECDGTDTSYVLLMAQSDPIDQVIFADYLVVDDADVEAFNTFLDSFYLDAELASAPPSDTSETTTTDESGPVYTTVTDDSETISVRVPEAWTDVVSEDWDLGDGPIGASLSVAPDVQDFNDTWETPGVFIGVSEEVAAAFTPDEVLDVFEFSDDCTYDDRYDYETDTLEGGYDVWLDCGDVAGSTFVVLAANPVGETSPIILLYTLLPTEEDTVVFGELVNTLGIAGAVQSAQASEQEQLLSNPTATVAVDRLNVRSGPGTNFNRVGAVVRGDALIVTGQVNNCGWLQIVTADELEGWVSGSSQYVTLDARCADIPEVEAPNAPAGGGTGSSSGGGQASSGSASQGCYLFQNGLGTELTITFTNRDSGRGETFKVAGNGEVEKCFAPGRYTYTLDAPPPWGSSNGELTVEAGDAFLFPINPE